MLDDQGIVVAVNQAWQRFAEENGLHSARAGGDYLGVCDRAAGPGAEDAHATAAGIRSVLAGTVEEFELEYACHAPGEERWFSMRVTSLVAGGRTFAVVAHQNVTRQHRASSEAEAARRHIAGVLESVTDAFFALDDRWRFTYVNPKSEILLRRPRTELLGQRIWDAFPEFAGTRFQEEYELVARERVPRIFEEYYEPLGAWFEVRAFPGEGGITVYYRDVTERRTRDQEVTDLLARLATERTLLDAVLQQLPVAVIIGEAPTGRLLLGNHQVEWIFGHGYRASTSIAEYADWEGFHLDGRRIQAHEWPLARALASGEWVAPEDFFIVRGDGTRGTARLSAAPVHDGAGNIIAGVVVAADVTAEAELTRTLQAQDERHRLIGLATSDVIWEWDLARGTLGWNDALEKVFGFAREETGDVEWWSERVHPDDRPRVMGSLEHVLAGREGVWFSEYRFLRADGSYVRVLDRAYVQRGEDGVPTRMIGSMVDLSATERAEEAVRLQALLLDTVEQAVIATDLEGRIIAWNRYAESLYGWSFAETVGVPLRELISVPEDHIPGSEIVQRVRSGSSWSGEYRVRRRDGTTFVALVMCSPIRNAQGETVGVVGVSTDTTERRHLEEQLRQSQKMQAVGQLAGGVAHDFNNLLTVISGTVQLIQMDMREADPFGDELRQIAEAADRAASLTRQLLAFSRKQVLQPRRVDLATLVAGLLPMLSRLIGEDVHLDFRTDGAIGQVEADPGQLEQVLLNLVLNARDAMPGGGRISAELREERTLGWGSAADGTPIPPGRYAVLTLSDTGTGIEPEVLDHIFEPFYTTKETGKGTGLGLSTVIGVLAQSGAYVSVRTEVGSGTSFTIYIPCVGGTAEKDATESPAAPRMGSGTVLIVEDEVGVRNLMRRILSRSGYTVLEAEDGEEALAVAERQGSEIDLVVSDVVMPRLSGPVAARRLREMIPGVPVIFMTGYTDDEIIRRGVHASDIRLLQKPFTTQSLLDAVAGALESKRA